MPGGSSSNSANAAIVRPDETLEGRGIAGPKVLELELTFEITRVEAERSEQGQDHKETHGMAISSFEAPGPA